MTYTFILKAMKKIKYLILLAAIATSFSACVVRDGRYHGHDHDRDHDRGHYDNGHDDGGR